MSDDPTDDAERWREAAREYHQQRHQDEVAGRDHHKEKAETTASPTSREEQKAKERVVDKLIKIAIDDSASDKSGANSSAKTGGLFHAPNGVCYADIPVGEHRETWPIRSRGFRRWLVGTYYKKTGTAPTSEALQSAIALADARAANDGPEREVFVRTGANGGKLYIDLANSNWEAVEVDATGWRIVAAPRVRFRRAAGMLPLPRPVRGGSIGGLRRFLNVSSDEDFVLAVCWELAALRNTGPYPIMALAGEQGSAKTTFARVARALVDPNAAPLRSLPREERDLAIAASNAHALVFDNLSHLSPWISDALCRIATGAGYATRQLYSDSDEVILDACRPIILTSIVDVATRADLADRALAFTLQPIAEDTRRSEREFETAFDAAAPQILGALLDGIAHGLRNLPHVRLAKLPRLADFGEWAAACETAYWPAGTFMKAYESNRTHLNETALEADRVGAAIEKLMATREEWKGKATELLHELNSFTSEIEMKSKEWPADATRMSGALRRCAPLLRRAGIEVHQTGGGRRRRDIVLRRSAKHGGKSASPASPASPINDFNGIDPDADLHRAHLSITAGVTPKSLKNNGGDAGDAGDAVFRQSSNDDLDIPDFLRRAPKGVRPPALGPPGDSLDDFH
jgi:hypothetical protein